MGCGWREHPEGRNESGEVIERKHVLKNHSFSKMDDVSLVTPRPQWGRRAIIFMAVLLIIKTLHFLVANPRFEWDVVAEFLTSKVVLDGLGVSIVLTIFGMALGTVLGTILALMKLGSFKAGRYMAEFYTWLFRGTPLLIQLLFWYNLAYLVPNIEIGLPFSQPWASWDTNVVITPFIAAVLGLALNEAAYMAEIMRAGIQSVDSGQLDAARSLGFRPAQAFFRIVLPQAMRFVLPPAGSQVIGMLKGTSLVSVIAMTDLLFSVQTIYNRTFKVVPMLMVAVIWYLAVFTLLTVIQRKMEAHFSRGHGAATSQPPMER